MSAGPSDRERISALETDVAHHAAEIALLREAKHRHAGILTAHGLIMKFACAVSAIVGAAIGAVVARMIGG